jgi:hypothetical protein
MEPITLIALAITFTYIVVAISWLSFKVCKNIKSLLLARAYRKRPRGAVRKGKASEFEAHWLRLQQDYPAIDVSLSKTI